MTKVIDHTHDIVCILNVAIIGIIPGYGFIKGAISLFRRKGATGKPKGYISCLLAIIISVLIEIILIALATPAFMRIMEPTKQSEANFNLKQVYKSQIAFYAKHHIYASLFKELEWKPEGMNRYSYFLPGEEIPATAPGRGPFSMPENFQAGASQTGFTAVAVGNVDNDATLDVWTINEKNELRNWINDITH